MTNLDSTLKSKDISLPTKVHIFKAVLFAVVMYGCESWTIKKREGWRIGAFKLWCCRKLLKFPWTERRSNQSILKELYSEYSLERLMLKLKLQYFGHLMQRANSLKRPWCWERLKAEGEKGDRRWDSWMASPIQRTWSWANSRRWWETGRPGVPQSLRLQRVRHDLTTEHTHTHTHTDLQTNKHHTNDLFSTRTLLKFYSKR